MRVSIETKRVLDNIRVTGLNWVNTIFTTERHLWRHLLRKAEIMSSLLIMLMLYFWNYCYFPL